MRNKGLAKLGDNLVNLCYSLAKSQVLGEATGEKVPYLVRPRRKGDVPVLLASKDKAEKILGWRLLHSDLETIIETAWKWHKKQSKK